MEKKYSDEELKRFREIEFFMWLRDIEEGKVLTEKQFKAIRHFLGDIIDKAKAVPMRSVSIHFDKNGEAHSIDNDGFIESVNGKKLESGIDSPNQKDKR